MEIAFATKALRQISENEIKAKREFGGAPAAQLKRRLADLHAATSISDLVAGATGECKVNGSEVSISLCDRFKVIISANHNKNPKDGSGRIEWGKVSRVKIERIEESREDNE